MVSKEGNSKSADNIQKPSFIIVLIVVALLLSSLTLTASAQTPASVRVLIAFSHLPEPAELALVRSYGGEIKYNYHLVPAIAASVPETAISALEKNPVVIRVDPDIEVHIVDAELDNAWGVKHIGSGLVHAGGIKGAGVKVGILDTGIDLDHPDLNYDPTCSANFVVGESLDDGHSHGTHVAGTVAALDNETGVVGVAPEVTLCIYKVFDSSGNGNYSDIIAAVQQAVDDGVQITNNSYGSLSDPGATVKAAFDNAYAAGVLQVGAAGNYGNIFGTGENCIYPARWDSVMAIAATMQNDTRASFSSTCPEVELAAPGYQINSTMPGGGYGVKNGTSMASPHVAGTAALVLAANSSWSNADLMFQLQITADELGDPGRDPWYGYGLVDADEAAGFSNTPPVADDQSVTTPEGTPVSIILTGSDPDGDALTFNLVTGPANGVLSGVPPNLTHTPNPGFYGSDSFSFNVNDGKVDSNVGVVSITVSPGPMHVGDLDGLRTTKKNQWTATVTISIHNASEGAVPGATVSGAWNGTGGETGCTTGGNGQCQVTSQGIPKQVNSVTFTVNNVTHAARAYQAADNHDPDGDSDGVTITVPPVTGNSAPIANNDSAATNLDTPVTIAVLANDSDPDGNPLSVTNLTQPANGAATLNADNTVTYTPNAGFSGNDSFTYTANDGTVDSNTATVSITVGGQTGEVTVMSINPDTVQAGASIEVTITGSGFLSGAGVTFENGSGAAPTASNIVVVDANTITATITVKSGGPNRNRVWDVRVTNPDGSSGVLQDGFTVTP